MRTGSELTRGELISTTSAVVLLVLMFGVAWYGVDGIPGRPGSSGALSGTENAWDGLSAVRWVMLLTAVLALGASAIHVRRPSRQLVAAVRLALLMAGMLTAVLTIVRVLIALPSANRVVDQKLGGLLGVFAALGIAYGAYEAVREQRARRIALLRSPAPQ
jgi:formate hydrogenlyase subunit 3/multisubunit Na+/H+ antiporter MnhD subunit